MDYHVGNVTLTTLTYIHYTIIVQESTSIIGFTAEEGEWIDGTI